MNRQDAKTPRSEPSEKLDLIAKAVVDASLHVHTELGPGLLERAYELCLAHRLRKLGHKVERQVDLPVFYDGIEIDTGFRLDLIVDDDLIVELKTVEALLPVHKAQVLTYLKLSPRTGSPDQLQRPADQGRNKTNRLRSAGQSPVGGFCPMSASNPTLRPWRLGVLAV